MRRMQQMLREQPQIGSDKPSRRSAERRCTAFGHGTKTALHVFEIGSLVRTITALIMRPVLVSRVVFCTVLLCAGLVLGSAAFEQALAQTSSTSVADRSMADRYERAAQRGDDVAQFYLGSLYAQGVGRPQSDTEAFRWIEQAAMRGNAQAMMVAAGLTALGKGTPKDYVISYKWAFLVAEGSQMADLKNGGRQLIGMLQPRMSADQVQAAKNQAYQFRAIGSSTAAPAPAPAAAPAAVPPTIVAPAPAAPALQSAAPTGGPTSTHSPSPAAVEAQKQLGKDNADKLLKNVPEQYRKRFGL